MTIKSIEVLNNGYVHCRSCFYSAQDIISNSKYVFHTGINMLHGEIDSGNWAVSYLLSMYKYHPKDFVLFEDPEIVVDNLPLSLREFSEISCYMDRSYPLFSSKASVREQIERGLKKSKLGISANEIKDLFCLDDERIKRPLTGVGNEVFRAMASIAYAYNKQVICFPWLSKMRFDGYHANISRLLEILRELDKIVIVPIGQ